MGSEMFTSWVESAETTRKMKTIKSNNFARTCNRFSQFLKERRSFGDNIAFNSIASPSLLPKLEEEGNDNLVEKKSLDLFPLTSSSSSLSLEESTKNMADSRESTKSMEEPKKCPSTASMTIFYDGKVLVFEDLQEDMAKEIMSLASQGGGTAIVPPSNDDAAAAISTHLTQGLADLPIVRRASLHRFMERRKDRIAASAPYQLNSTSSSKQMFKQQEEHQLELKLW